MGLNKKFYLTEDEVKLLFSDVTVISDMKELEGLTIHKVVENRIETEVDDDSAYATHILVIHASGKDKKKRTYVLSSDISPYGGYEICPQSEIKVRLVNDKPEVYWDVESPQADSGMTYPRYLGFTLEGIKKAAEWGIVRYGIVPMAEKYIQETTKQQEINRIESLKKQLENTQNELAKALGKHA